MELLLDPKRYDLVTPDGRITSLDRSAAGVEARVLIEDISPHFVGFQIDKADVLFNLKSTLAQVGLDGLCLELSLDQRRGVAEVRVLLKPYGVIGREMLEGLPVGAYIGKLFAADERRRVRDPNYLARMFGRADRWGKPLLALGGLEGGGDLILEKVEGRTVAYLALRPGVIRYDETIRGFLPTIANAFKKKVKIRELLKLYQRRDESAIRNIQEGEMLLVQTQPLHVRTVFGRVVDSLMNEGYHHTSASVLQPDTEASGDVYELFGDSRREVTDIPLEFYTLDPYREYVFFSDRDQLLSCIEDSTTLFRAFENAPKPIEQQAAVFVVKGHQLLSLKPEDWIAKQTFVHEFPGPYQGARQALMVERYMREQPSYPFLKGIEDDLITSQGILLTRYFPSPLLAQMLLSYHVQTHVKGIYFQYPSVTNNTFFSHEDRTLMHHLYKFAIPLYWVDQSSNQVLQYIQKPNRDSGLFVPLSKVNTYLQSTVFGIYGSNLVEGHCENEVKKMLEGLLDMREEFTHPLLHKGMPLALITGGGPGAMAVGNRIAKELGILSCANVVDFGGSDSLPINEQKQNPFVEAKMTYRLDRLVERQAEFYLDFPIFLTGGVGTDFEFCLEEVRRKVGAAEPTPVILFGDPEYWRKKITPRFQANLQARTNKGSEWLSNCWYCIQTAQEGLQVYRDFFEGSLPIGPGAPANEDGFVVV